MVGESDPFYLKFWVNRPPLERNRRFWTDIRSYRLSSKLVTPSEKVQLTLRSPVYALPMPKILIVCCP